MEFWAFFVDIVLVHFIGKDEKSLFVSKFDDFFDIFSWQDLSSYRGKKNVWLINE